MAEESDVFLANINNVIPGKGLNWQLALLFEKAGFSGIVKGKRVAIKMHPSEAYGDSYIRPSSFRRLVDKIKEAGGDPFCAEATPLYRGPRMTSTGLLESCTVNGFTEQTLGCPIVCADGPNVTEAHPFNGEGVTLPIPKGEEMKEQEIASAFVKADAMIIYSVISPSGGLRGIIKSIGMGCATKRGKAKIHTASIVEVDPEKCIGCGSCIQFCAWDAIKMVNGKSVIDPNKCKGCLMCWDACNHMGALAVHLRDKDGYIKFQRRLADSAAALINQKKGNLGYIGSLRDIKLECECHPHSRNPFVPDIGIIMGKDPVAMDTAAYDLINHAPGLPGTVAEGWGPDTDKTKIAAFFPEFSLNDRLDYCEKLGLGTRNYRLWELQFTGVDRSEIVWKQISIPKAKEP